MTFALHRRRLVGQRMPTVVKKRVVRDAQREKPLWEQSKAGGKVGKKTPAFGFINETGDYLKNGSPGRIRTGDLSINSRMLYR